MVDSYRASDVRDGLSFASRVPRLLEPRGPTLSSGHFGIFSRNVATIGECRRVPSVSE
jgi:hypothetical protein